MTSGEVDSDRGLKLALELATLSGEVPHEILVGVAKDFVVVGAVLGEVQLRLLEDGHQIRGAANHLLTLAEFVRVFEVREVRAGEAGVRVDERLHDLGIDQAADVTLALEGNHVIEPADGTFLEGVAVLLEIGVFGWSGGDAREVWVHGMGFGFDVRVRC